MKHEIIPIMADCRVGTAHQSRLCHSERSEESHPRHCEESAVRRTTCQSLFNLLNSKFSILHSKFLLLLCTCALVLFLIAAPAHAKYGGGTGEPNDPYLIYTAEQMNEIGLSVNRDDWDKHFLLMADIDLSTFTGTSFNIIGAGLSNPFTGVFDGNGHTISNFTFSSTEKNYIGLFGYVSGENALIKDLGLIGPNVDAGTRSNVGSLVGRLSDGTTTNCYAEFGSVSGRIIVGGLVGRNWGGTISNCYSTGSVSGTTIVGGLVGDSGYGTISNCYSVGDVSGNDRVGGLVGYNYKGTIENCYAADSVSGDWYIGGLVGSNEGTITNCYSTGSVSGTTHVGGLVGENGFCSREGCYPGSISNCYSTGSVTGTSYVGGLVGFNSEGAITNCYSTGNISGDSRVGGLVGHGYRGVMFSFWDIETSGQSTSAGGTGKTTAEMQTASTFFAWGCGAVWTIDEGADYPRLAWENMPGEVITNPSYWEGNGTETDPYLIYTAEELNTIGLVPCSWDKHFLLCADIDLSGFTGTSFNIIGTGWRNSFTGVFDGSGHTISNFTFSSTEKNFIGIFGYIDDPNAEIKDLGLVDPNIDAGTGNNVGSLVGYNLGTITGCYVEGGSVAGNRYVGGLVGYNSYGTISNCYSTGDVSGKYRVGGLVGENGFCSREGCYPGSISNCYSTGNVSGDSRVGGLVGLNDHGTITNCYSSGGVSGDRNIGGLVGWNRYGRISNCYSTGSVSGGDNVGGMVGANFSSSTITNCYATGDVSGTDNDVGGLVGVNYYSTITDCYATGSVTGADFVGGLVGNNEYGTITNCYATGTIWGDTRVGGLVGDNYAMIYNCYSIGSVLGTADVGGLVGYGHGQVRGCFWDTESSGQSTSVGGTGKTTAQMQLMSTFTDASWGCESVWTIDEGVDYPRLVWENKPGELITVLSGLYGGGSGDPNDPYLIYTAEQLNTIGSVVCDWDKHFKLMADIDLSVFTGTDFNIIGIDYYNPFSGVFDGSGHTISNFTFSSTEKNFIGIFGYIDDPNAEIKDLGLVDPNIDAGTGNDVGSLVGYNLGTITGCYVEGGSVAGNRYVGGLVGAHYEGTITNCYSTGTASGNRYVGGLVGYNHGTITNCYSTGSVSGDRNIGGLVGWNELEGTISNCYASGDVSGDWAVGGLVGDSGYGTISNCYSVGDVSGNDRVGGLVGYNLRGSISNCYLSGDVSGNSNVGGLVGGNFGGTITDCYSIGSVVGTTNVGGLVGSNGETITNSYATGSVTGTTNVGGLVGQNGQCYSWGCRPGTVSTCYSTGSVSGDENVGGLVGGSDEWSYVSGSFWDTQTSGQLTSVGGTGLPTVEMQTESTFTNAGWDFVSIWWIFEGVGYPRLSWEIPVLHTEPEVTLGTSNTISWDPVPGANDYYAECAEDASFTSILHSTGWITETSYEFTGLELGQRYWYSVKARNIAGTETNWSNVESSLQCTLADAVAVMLDLDTLKNKNMKNALLNKINAVQQMLDAGRYEEALNKLQNDILQKTDGCAETGRPDKNDWIITCEEQGELYPLIIETIEHVMGLMNQ